MLPTPSTSHVNYDLIYEPAEDSYLFLDTLSSEHEKAWLQNRLRLNNTSRRAPLLLEIGPGSGVIIAFLSAHAKTVFGTEVLALSVDVNSYAATATMTTVDKAIAETVNETAGVRSVYLSSLLGDLTTPIRLGEVDVLVFNPPYVPTESAPTLPQSTGQSRKPTFEDSSKLLELSYAGGQDGMEITNRLFAQIPDVLGENGVAYILFCQGNKPKEVKQRIRGWERGKEWEWCAETVGTSGKTAGWEKLIIVRIWRERAGEKV